MKSPAIAARRRAAEGCRRTRGEVGITPWLPRLLHERLLRLADERLRLPLRPREGRARIDVLEERRLDREVEAVDQLVRERADELRRRFSALQGGGNPGALLPELGVAVKAGVLRSRAGDVVEARVAQRRPARGRRHPEC